MYYLQVFVLFVILLININVDSFKLTGNENANSIHLEAPHLTDRSHSDRPSLDLFRNTTRPRMKNRKKINTTVLYPCGSTFVKTNGTTCGLRQIMIGRCYEFEYIKRGFIVANDTNVKNCTEIYGTFETAVRYKQYCNMNMSTYADYFALALAGVQVINRAMFWSGTYVVTHAYSANGLNYITLEDTLAAAMVNGLMWCGKENDTEGYDFVSCPNNCKDNIWADFAFWGLASKTFAQLAAGEIYVVLNGSQTNGRTAFRNNSYFSDFELPNFRRTGEYRVTKVNVLLLHSPDQDVTEKCGEKSLITLEKLVRTQGFDYACKDDPDELILIMCGNEWNARECQIARSVLRQEWNRKLYGTSHSQMNSLPLPILISVLLFRVLF